ncbi:IS110 family transposase [Streptomyces sp. NPDC006459]|uniref:IS110 family transposase n=1 Tax=Streptomyces sp. NPDC006459 TaxID=3154303 RepID=UPI0033B53EC7
MTQFAPLDQETSDIVLGVDTHKDVHVAAVVTAAGVFVESRSFPTTAKGYEQLLAWARTLGHLNRAGVECTGSYGAALSRYLHGRGITVFEVNQPDKATRRRRGKSDIIDAEAAARAVITGRATATAKAGDGPVEMLRLFKTAKASAIKSRAQAIDQLKAVLVVTDPELRESLAGLSNPKLIRACAGLNSSASETTGAATAHTLKVLAPRIQHPTEEIEDLTTRIRDLITQHNPQLLACYGVGPDTAATLLIAAGDNPERLHSEPSFAALCGVSPVEASSGKTQRRRLNRGGNRQANSALYTIVLARLRWDPHPRIHRQASFRGQNPTRSTPLPQTLCCARDRPAHHPHHHPRPGGLDPL